jgi:hypothetical protein
MGDFVNTDNENKINSKNLEKKYKYIPQFIY